MCRLLGSITSTLKQLFGNFWGDPTPPEPVPEPLILEPELEEKPEVDSKGTATM